MNTEEWRACVPNYEISSYGRVRRCTPGRRTFVGRVMSLIHGRNGYLCVSPTVDGVNKRFYVHDLVATAFIGPKPEWAHVNHIDGDKTNNRTSNLEYVMREGNMAHAAVHGLMVCGESHPQHKLNADSVKQLRQDRSDGLSFSMLANKYGVSIATAFNAAKGINWRNVA